MAEVFLVSHICGGSRVWVYQNDFICLPSKVDILRKFAACCLRSAQYRWPWLRRSYLVRETR